MLRPASSCLVAMPVRLRCAGHGGQLRHAPNCYVRLRLAGKLLSNVPWLPCCSGSSGAWVCTCGRRNRGGTTSCTVPRCKEELCK